MIFRLALILAALGAALVPLPPSWVEQLYSERAYLVLQRVLTPASNRVPFALLDLLVGAAAAWLVLSLVRAVRGRRKTGVLRGAGIFLFRLGAAAAVVYLAFVLLWGLNYRRVPLSRRLSFSSERVTADATRSLARTVVRRANALRAAGQGQGAEWAQVPALIGPSFEKVQGQLAGVHPAAGGTPKQTLLTYLFERSGVDGMTDPFFLEVLVNRSILPFERPVITAHEWAHLAGYADESEANFIGWLVCLQGPPAAEYSADLALLWQVLPALPAGEREALVRQIDPRVRGDLRAIAARVSRATPMLRHISWRVYDRYLKANRVEKGVESYDAALTLLLGTRLSDGWVPARR